MDYRQTLLVLLSVLLLCSSQGLKESSTETNLIQKPSGTSTQAISTSSPQENVSDLLKMMNKLNHRVLELTKTVIRLDEINSRIMTRLDEMNSESVKRFEEINSTMMTRLDEMNSESLKRFEENNSTMFSLFDETDLHVKSLEVSAYRKEKQFVLFTGEKKTWIDAYNDCIKRNMSLASIESEEDNNKLVSLVKKSDRGDDFWLTGTDLGHTDRYVWKSTGRDVTYNQWQQGEPDHYIYNGEVAHCMYVVKYGMRWYDGYCSFPGHYICHHWV